MENFPYCPPEVKISDIWSNCFIETFSASVLTGFIVIFGLVHLFNYWKYAKPISDLASPKLYHFQIFLLTIIPSLSIVDFTHFYGYTIFVTSLTCLSYLMSIWLVLTERFYLIPEAPKRRHSAVLLIFWSLFFINENISMIKFKHGPVYVIRYACSLLVLILGFLSPGIPLNPTEKVVQPSDGDDNDDDDDKIKKPFIWTEQLKKLHFLLRYFWPKTNLTIQINTVCCITVLIFERFTFALIPIYDQRIVDSLGDKVYCWDMILVFVFFKFLEHGFLYNIRTYLWTKIENFMDRETKIKIFSQIHNLSLRWHLARKTGTALSIVNSGGSSITALIEHTIFYILPQIIDIISSMTFLSIAFNWYFGVVLIVPMCLYSWLTIMISQWRRQSEKNVKASGYEQYSRCIDSLLNFETVKYCGAEKYEIKTFCEALSKCQRENSSSVIYTYLLDTIQAFIIYGTLLAGSLFCAYLVADIGSLTPGQYVFFVSHITQLYNPLDMLTYLYRRLQRTLLDVETVFDLLNEKQEIVDAPTATELSSVRGEIEFSNVTFGYTPEEIVLKNVSFSVPAGKTVAIVGPSGAGKSSIIRLLFRFYDVLEGTVYVDGHDIKCVKQESLRRAIGVVPQDTILFNNTIKHNIKYGRLDASDDDVIEAARAAEIHEKIMKFTKKYETEVGERGLRLSGGEKQRVAIARTILKAPSIMLLDEATSALDTQTERNIQSALAKVCANRTTVIVAHRLSTIIHADEILVMKNGEIVERGRHSDLLSEKGIYADMWNMQLQSDDVKAIGNDIPTAETHQKSD